jgi:hypothetical protein
MGLICCWKELLTLKKNCSSIVKEEMLLPRGWVEWILDVALHLSEIWIPISLDLWITPSPNSSCQWSVSLSRVQRIIVFMIASKRNWHWIMETQGEFIYSLTVCLESLRKVREKRLEGFLPWKSLRLVPQKGLEFTLPPPVSLQPIPPIPHTVPWKGGKKERA